jgi:uncharacterized protein (DUF1697 family)
MEHLRALCSDIGFQNVETYVQSGNVVFQTTAGNPVAISKSISEVILESLGFDVPVIVRTSKEIRSVIANNPFLKEKNIDSSKLHVTFLSETPQKGPLKKLEALAISPDQFYSAPHENLPVLSRRIRRNPAFEQCNRKSAFGKCYHSKLEDDQYLVRDGLENLTLTRVSKTRLKLT